MRQVIIRHGRVRAYENLNWPSELASVRGARLRLIYAPPVSLFRRLFILDRAVARVAGFNNLMTVTERRTSHVVWIYPAIGSAVPYLALKKVSRKQLPLCPSAKVKFQ